MSIFGKRRGRKRKGGKGREHLGDETLSEYLSGRLPPEEARHVDTHVDTCAVCRQELDSLGYTVGLMQRVPMAPPRTTFVLSEAPVGDSRRGPVSWLPGWAYGAAASVAVIVFAVVLSADVVGLLAGDAATPAPASPISLEDTAAFAPATLAAAPVPESAAEEADVQSVGLEGEAQASVAMPAPTGAVDGSYERTVDLETAAPAATSAPMPTRPQATTAVAMYDEEEPLPSPTPAPAAAPALEKAMGQRPDTTQAPAAATPASSVAEALAAELTAIPEEEVGEPADVYEAEEAVKTTELDVADIRIKEGQAPVTAAPTPAELATPISTPVAEATVDPTAAVGMPADADGAEDVVKVDTPAPVPTSKLVQGPEPAPPAITNETTSILWRIVEGIAGGLALVAGGTFLWMKRRQGRLLT